MEFAHRPEWNRGAEAPCEQRRLEPPVEQAFTGHSYRTEVTGILPTDRSALDQERPSVLEDGDASAEQATEVAEMVSELYVPDTKFRGLPVLPPAEHLDPAQVRDYIATLIEHHGAKPGRQSGTLIEIASALGELGLATLDDAEAAAAFTDSEELYRAAAAGMRPDSFNQLRAERAAAFTPVWRMRRAGAGRAEMAETAYGVLTQSLHRTLPLLENRQELSYAERGQLTGLLAEDSVAALRTRDGQPAFISSAREGYGGHPGEPRQASDFHLLSRQAREKIRAEVKLDKTSSGDRRHYDTKNIVLVSYQRDVCRPLLERQYPERSRPPTFDFAMKVSSLLAQEGGRAGTMSQADRRTLDLGSMLVKQKIDNWLQDRARRQGAW